MFRVALSKGRILADTLPLLSAVGIELAEDPSKTRKLIIPATFKASTQAQPMSFEMVVLRATDVPTFVQHGAADFGFVGKDVLLEHGGGGIYELLDLGIAKCRLMVAAIKDAPDITHRPLQVATKFINVARHYYSQKGQQVQLIKLYGSMELAPLVELADRIVDIVDTGNTLKANGLEPVELIAEISTRFIVNTATYRRDHQSVIQLVNLIRNVL